MSRKIVFAISGWKRSGKDTLAEILSDECAKLGIKSYKYSFADPIKEIANTVFGLDYTEDKEKMSLKLKEFFNENCSYRTLLIQLGEGFKELFGKNIWVNSLNQKVHQLDFSEDTVLIFPDVRYKVELKYLRKLKEEGFEVYHLCIFRQDALPLYIKDGLYPYLKDDLEIIKKKYDVDKSEYEWCAENPKIFAKLNNDSSLSKLQKAVKEKVIDKIFK